MDNTYHNEQHDGISRYILTQNDPFDKETPIKLITEQLMSSTEYMKAIRDFNVPDGGLAIWLLGQNSFVLKSDSGPLIMIDPYLTNSCAKKFQNLPFRLDRQLPVFIEPEDLDVDLVLFTHSHEDHFDTETLERLQIKKSALFIGPWEAYNQFEDFGIPQSCSRLIHPNQVLEVEGVNIRGTFAFPTDHLDLNHIGYLLEFANGIKFYNSGDTQYCELLGYLRAFDIDICTICINGSFHNLSHMEAAEIVKRIQPKVVIPFHYDMMVDNVCSPEMFHVMLRALGCKSAFQLMPYYKPWIYTRQIEKHGIS